MTHENLTAKQRRLLNYIKEYTSAHNYPPSLKEMADHMGIRSLSTVHQHLETLRKKDAISKKPSRERNVETADAPKLIKVPLLGQITAGLPIEQVEDAEPVYIPTSIINDPSDHYALKVVGDSMIDDGIQDGDIVLVRHQNYVDYKGQVVVAIAEGEATLKRFGGVNEHGQVKLLPRNPKLSSIIVDRSNFSVRGVFVGLIRN